MQPLVTCPDSRAVRQHGRPHEADTGPIPGHRAETDPFENR